VEHLEKDIREEKEMAVYRKRREDEERRDYTPPEYGGNRPGAEAGRYYQAMRAAEEGFSNPYAEDIEALMERLNTMPKYSYDANADPLYQSIRDRAVRDGKMAARDTTARMAGLTGGMGNSYAASAGNQAAQEHLRRATEQLPALEGNARTAYYADMDAQLERLNMLLGMTDRELSAWQQERAYNRDAYADALGREAAYWGGSSGGGYGGGGSGGGAGLPYDREDAAPSYREAEAAVAGMGSNAEAIRGYLNNQVAIGKLTKEEGDAIWQGYTGEAGTYKTAALTNASDAMKSTAYDAVKATALRQNVTAARTYLANQKNGRNITEQEYNELMRIIQNDYNTKFRAAAKKYAKPTPANADKIDRLISSYNLPASEANALWDQWARMSGFDLKSM
jgi:hypothetical protein